MQYKYHPDCKHWKVWWEYGELFADCDLDMRRGCCCPHNCSGKEEITEANVGLGKKDEQEEDPWS